MVLNLPPDLLAQFLWQAGLLLACGLFFVLLLLPALDEWAAPQSAPPPLHPSDKGPDPISVLRRLAHEDFSDMLKHVETHGGVTRGIDLDGEPVLILGPKEVLAAQIETSTSRLRHGVLACQRLDVPGEIVCERDLFAGGRAAIAQNAVVRNLLGLRDVVVGVRARVTHHVHADGRLDVAEGAWLHGTASAGMAATISRRARFYCIEAPLIEFGPVQSASFQPHGSTKEFVPENGEYDRGSDRWLVKGDLTIPAGHKLSGDLVIGGRLLVLENSVINGSVRAEKSVRLSRGARVDGAIVSPSDVRLAENCRVTGPLQAGTRMHVAEGCVIGSRARPTSVSAARLRISTGCIAHGSVVSTQGGQVLAPQEIQA